MSNPSERQVVDLSDESIQKLAAAVGQAVEDTLQRLDPGTREVRIAEIGAGAFLDMVEAIKRAAIEE